LKDDFINKLKTILSGSKSIENNQEQKPVDEDMVNNFMNQILDAAWLEEDLKATHAPCYYLSTKSKSYWLMNTTSKSLFNIKCGIEIIPIEPGEPNTLCLIGQSTYSIPNIYIVCSGWN
jgi:hypothetical protein